MANTIHLMHPEKVLKHLCRCDGIKDISKETMDTLLMQMVEHLDDKRTSFQYEGELMDDYCWHFSIEKNLEDDYVLCELIGFRK